LDVNVPFGPKKVKERRNFLLPVYKLIRYHRLVFNSIGDGALRWTYLPWIESITHVKVGEEEELELRLNSNYEKVWRMLKERLDEPGVRLKSQYSSRLYQWAKQYVPVGYKRVSLLPYGKFWVWKTLGITQGESFRKHLLRFGRTLSNGRLIPPSRKSTSTATFNWRL
jgi:hypothetical protein